MLDRIAGVQDHARSGVGSSIEPGSLAVVGIVFPGYFSRWHAHFAIPWSNQAPTLVTYSDALTISQNERFQNFLPHQDSLAIRSQWWVMPHIDPKLKTAIGMTACLLQSIGSRPINPQSQHLGISRLLSSA